MLQPTETWLTWAFGFVASDKHIACAGRPSPRNDECRLLVPDTFSSSLSRVLCERPLIVGLGRTLGLHAPRAQLLYREPSTRIRALAPFLESGSCCRIPIGARASASPPRDDLRRFESLQYRGGPDRRTRRAGGTGIR